MHPPGSKKPTSFQGTSLTWPLGEMEMTIQFSARIHKVAQNVQIMHGDEMEESVGIILVS